MAEKRKKKVLFLISSLFVIVRIRRVDIAQSSHKYSYEVLR